MTTDRQVGAASSWIDTFLETMTLGIYCLNVFASIQTLEGEGELVVQLVRASAQGMCRAEYQRFDPPPTRNHLPCIKLVFYLG